MNSKSAKPRLDFRSVIQAIRGVISQLIVGILANWLYSVIVGVGAIGVLVSVILLDFLRVQIAVPLWGAVAGLLISAVAGSLILLFAILRSSRLRELIWPSRSQTQQTAKFPEWHKELGFRWKAIPTWKYIPALTSSIVVDGPYCLDCYDAVSAERYYGPERKCRYVCQKCGRELLLDVPMETLKELGEQHVLASYRKYLAEKEQNAIGLRR